MLIAAFRSTSVLAGKTVTYEGGQFILQDYGPLTLDQLISYDRQGHLDWTRDDLRGWAFDVAGATPKQHPTTVLPSPASVTAPQPARTIGQAPTSRAVWGGGSGRPTRLSSAARILIGVGVGLVALVIIAAIVASGGGSSLTSAERTQLAFFADHAPQLRALIDDTQAVLDSGRYDANYMVGAMKPIVDSYKQLADETSATNGGNLVGGHVAHLESLWGSCTVDVGTVVKAILECYASPETVDTKAAGVALHSAVKSRVVV